MRTRWFRPGDLSAIDLRLDTPEHDEGPAPENYASDLGLWWWSG